MFSDVRPSGGSTPSATLANLPCVDLDRRPAPFVEDLSLDSPVELPALKACMPSANVIAWLRDHLPVEAVIATNRWNPVFLPLVVPQQIAAFPGTDRTLEQERALFGEYYRFYADRMRAHRVQPFFNAVETPTERAAFLSALGVTHVVLDPASFDEIRPVLDGRPDLFTRQYVGDGWAVYGVRGAALGSVGQGEYGRGPGGPQNRRATIPACWTRRGGERGEWRSRCCWLSRSPSSPSRFASTPSAARWAGSTTTISPR
jgi:hypothetical protein